MSSLIASSFALVAFASFASSCQTQRCPVSVSPNSGDSCYGKSLLEAPSNLTLYEGESHTVYAEAPSGCNIRVTSTNTGCIITSNSLHTNTTGNITYMEYSLTDVSEADNDTCFKLHLLGDLGSVSCDHTVCITVIGPPPPPSDLIILPTCYGLFINGLWPGNTSYLVVHVTNGHSHNISSLPIAINITHFKEFIVTIYGVNRAGTSLPYRKRFNYDNFIYFEVSNFGLYLSGDDPYLNFTISVNTSCPGSIPHSITGISNCFINGRNEIEKNITRRNRLIHYSLPLVHGADKCSFACRSGRHHENVFSNQSTSGVQNVSIALSANGSLTVNCTLLTGARGCGINVYNDDTGIKVHTEVFQAYPGSNYAVGSTGHLLPAGVYRIDVYSLKGNGNMSSDIASTKWINVTSLPCTDDCPNGGSSIIDWRKIVIPLLVVTFTAIAIAILIVALVVYYKTCYKRKSKPVTRETKNNVHSLSKPETFELLAQSNTSSEHDQNPYDMNHDVAPSSEPPPPEEREPYQTSQHQEQMENGGLNELAMSEPSTLESPQDGNDDNDKKVVQDTGDDLDQHKSEIVPHNIQGIPPSTTTGMPDFAGEELSERVVSANIGNVSNVSSQIHPPNKSNATPPFPTEESDQDRKH